MPFHLASLWGAAYKVCDGLRQNEIMRVGKNSGPLLSRLWTKDHEILGQCRRPFVLSNALARLSMLRLFLQIGLFAIKPRARIRRKTEQMLKVFGPWFFGGTTPTFLRQIVSATYRPPFGKVWLSSGCWSPSAKRGNAAEFTERGWKLTSSLKPFAFQSSCSFETM